MVIILSATITLWITIKKSLVYWLPKPNLGRLVFSLFVSNMRFIKSIHLQFFGSLKRRNRFGFVESNVHETDANLFMDQSCLFMNFATISSVNNQLFPICWLGSHYLYTWTGGLKWVIFLSFFWTYLNLVVRVWWVGFWNWRIGSDLKCPRSSFKQCF